MFRFIAVVACTISATLLAGCHAFPDTQRARNAVVPLNHLPALEGDYFRLDSTNVGRPFHIYVRFPPEYARHPDTRYPVVYLLDGDSLFPILAANHLFLNYDEGVPEAIVVGIAYGSFDPATNKRGYDFSAPGADAEAGQGGAPAFLGFLKNELIPTVEARYRTNPARRILFGQSRGGYFVLYSAFTDPDLFWGRIASNPPFAPGRARFYSEPSASADASSGLVVTSGTRDRPANRGEVLTWAKSWADKQKPWALKVADIEGGTHAANSVDSYRLGLIWLFDRVHELHRSPSP
ncbi:MAG: alpha/beta hydrolase-fold protein [Steroidobacteraceae bacterium]